MNYALLLLRPLFKLADLIYEESSPGQLAAGAAAGLVLGLIPVSTLHWAILLLLVICLRVNLLVTLLTALFFAATGWVLSTFFHKIGIFILTDIPPVQPFLAWMFHAPVLPFTRFYNSVVLGSSLFSMSTGALLFFLGRRWLRKHQSSLTLWALNSSIWRAFEDSQAYALYAQYRRSSR